MKALILSVKPEHACNILTGKKTLEIRKRVPKGFKGWVYVYVTFDKEVLEKSYLGYRTLSYRAYDTQGIGVVLNGTIPFRFWFDEYERFNNHFNGDEWYFDFKILDNACIEDDDLSIYLSGKNQDGHFKFGYAWHIKKLDIFSKPMQLGEKMLMKAYKKNHKVKVNKSKSLSKEEFIKSIDKNRPRPPRVVEPSRKIDTSKTSDGIQEIPR